MARTPWKLLEKFRRIHLIIQRLDILAVASYFQRASEPPQTVNFRPIADVVGASRRRKVDGTFGRRGLGTAEKSTEIFGQDCNFLGDVSSFFFSFHETSK